MMSSLRLIQTIETSAITLAVTLGIGIFWALVDANIRHWAAVKGHDAYLLKLLDLLPGWGRKLLAGWLPLRQLWWLWFCFGLSSGLGISLWLLDMPRQPIQIYEPKEPLTADDVATKLSIWDSLINNNLTILTEAYNSLDLAQSRWPRLVDSVEGRQQLYKDITNSIAAYENASKELEILRSEYLNYKDVAEVLAQPARPELERMASNFANAISNIPPTPPPRQILKCNSDLLPVH